MGIISSGYYQVPNKVVGTLNINNDIVYVPTMSSNVDINFGTLALSNEIPLAGKDVIGGFKLFQDPSVGSETATIDPLGKKYAVLLCSIAGVNWAYVYIPWKNTTYGTDPADRCLCIDYIQDETKDDGGYAVFGISENSITEKKLSIESFGDMVFNYDGKNRYAWFANVRDDITNSILLSLDTEIDNRCTLMQSHEINNNKKFDEIDQEFKDLCDAISIDYYDITETSSKQEISAALSGLSDCIVDYYENPDLNPAYLQYETSSKVELENKFNTKQDNLNIYDTINKESYTRYNRLDVPNVSATIKYIAAELDKFEATYLGHFTKWSLVPVAATGYSKTPDKNDYIYVDITPGDGSGLTDYGTCKFKMAADEWVESKGRNNWEFEIKINDSPFTEDQLNAINSGITTQLVDQIRKNKSDIESLSSYLASLIGSCKKEKWIFELQDSSTVEKTMLVQ